MLRKILWRKDVKSVLFSTALFLHLEALNILAFMKRADFLQILWPDYGFAVKFLIVIQVCMEWCACNKVTVVDLCLSLWNLSYSS